MKQWSIHLSSRMTRPDMRGSASCHLCWAAQLQRPPLQAFRPDVETKPLQYKHVAAEGHSGQYLLRHCPSASRHCLSAATGLLKLPVRASVSAKTCRQALNQAHYHLPAVKLQARDHLGVSEPACSHTCAGPAQGTAYLPRLVMGCGDGRRQPGDHPRGQQATHLHAVLPHPPHLTWRRKHLQTTAGVLNRKQQSICRQQQES